MGGWALHQVFLLMLPQPVEDSHSSTGDHSSETQHGTRRRRHHRRSFYSLYIRPYKRELRTVILFCIFVAVTYWIWNTLAAN
jgi:hypothetical protein